MKGTVLDEAVLRMVDDDTVGTALADLDQGRRLDDVDPSLVVAGEIGFGHKVALVDHDAGDPVRKYGEVVGEATAPIGRGEWVHTHNCESRRGRGDRTAAVEGKS